MTKIFIPFVDSVPQCALPMIPVNVGGMSGQISWERVLEILRSSGEIKSHEELDCLVADENGLKFYLNRR